MADTTQCRSYCQNNDRQSSGHQGNTRQSFDKEEHLIEVIRAHLREARINKAVGKLTFELDINRGGIARYWVDLTCRYRFLEGFNPAATISDDGKLE